MLSRAAVGAGALIGLELLYAVFRPAPKQEEFDPSANFGVDGGRPLRVAVLGDSTVTAPGVGAPDEIWVSHVCRMLGDSHHVELKSFAVGGSTAHDLVNDQMEPALAFRPDLVILSVGANDALKGVTPTRFEANLEILVSRFRETGATVVQSGVGDLGTIPRLYPPLRQLLTNRALRFNAVHERVAARHGAWVVPQRDSPVEIWADPAMWSPDLFHVSSRGHEVWGRLGWKTVAQALGLDGA